MQSRNVIHKGAAGHCAFDSKSTTYWLHGPRAVFLSLLGDNYRSGGMPAWLLVEWGEHGTERPDKIAS